MLIFHQNIPGLAHVKYIIYTSHCAWKAAKDTNSRQALATDTRKNKSMLYKDRLAIMLKL